MIRYGKIRAKLEEMLFNEIPNLSLGQIKTIAPVYKSPKVYGATSASWSADGHITNENGRKTEVYIYSLYTMGFLVKHGGIEIEIEERNEIHISPKGAKEESEKIKAQYEE